MHITKKIKNERFCKIEIGLALKYESYKTDEPIDFQILKITKIKFLSRLQ